MIHHLQFYLELEVNSRGMQRNETKGGTGGMGVLPTQLEDSAHPPKRLRKNIFA